MKCQRCSSERILSFCAKTSDLCNAEYDGKTHSGLTPEVECLGGGGDYLSMDVCLSCGQVQGDFPQFVLKFNCLFEWRNEEELPDDWAVTKDCNCQDCS
jgi:hypothetical protein